MPATAAAEATATGVEGTGLDVILRTRRGLSASTREN